jgi:hypothetical protein
MRFAGLAGGFTQTGLRAGQYLTRKTIIGTPHPNLEL